jgi:hypothetical protein
MKIYDDPGRSLAFFSRQPARSEASMATWAAIALLLILAVLAFGGPS